MVKIFYEFTGKYLVDNNKLFVFNKLNNKNYEISGEDIYLFNKILPYLTGIFSFDRICTLANVKEELAVEVINHLKKLNLIKEFEVTELKLFLLNDGDLKSKSLQESLMNNGLLKDIKKFTKEEELNKFSETDDKSLILCINFNNNKDFIQKIEFLSLYKKINYLNISILNDRWIIGPLLSYEDGPCSNCLEKSFFLENKHHLSPSILPYETITEILVNELIRFTRQDTYVNVFNTAIELDFSELKFRKTKIYRYPNCKQCKFKGELA